VPAIDGVVLVQEALSEAQTGISQWHMARVDQAILAVHPTMDEEAMQMLATPAKGHLQGSVQVGHSAVATHEQASPDQQADAAQDDA
jgi:hypothetical protein